MYAISTGLKVRVINEANLFQIINNGPVGITLLNTVLINVGECYLNARNDKMLQQVLSLRNLLKSQVVVKGVLYHCFGRVVILKCIFFDRVFRS